MPWYEKYNQIQTLVPGEQSVVYPGAPAGLVFPGDPGVAPGLASTRWNNLSPRFGLAWTPHGGHTTGRLGGGRFFTAIEGVSAGVMAGDPPYGSTYVSPAPPLFNDPFARSDRGHVRAFLIGPFFRHRCMTT
jgi:hypothetical protein